MSLTGFSVQHDGEVQQHNRTRTTILARQEQRRQEFRRQLGIPDPVEDDRSLLRRIFNLESKQNQWLDKQLVQSMAAAAAAAANEAEDESSGDDDSMRKVERTVENTKQ